MHFTLNNVLQFRLGFLRSLLFYFFSQFNGLFQCHENVGVVNLQEIPLRIHLYGSRVSRLQGSPKCTETGIEIWIQSQRFLLYMDNHFSFIVRISKNQRNSILVHFVDWLFHALQTLSNQWLSNYHTSMISSNILSLGSFFGNMKTPTRKIVTRMIPTGQFPLGKLPQEKIPTQDKSQLDNSHPGKLPPGKFPAGTLPPRKTPTRKTPTWKISTQENSQPDNSHPDNSHTGDSHQEKFSSSQLLPRIISTQLI